MNYQLIYGWRFELHSMVGLSWTQHVTYFARINIKLSEDSVYCISVYSTLHVNSEERDKDTRQSDLAD